MVGVAYVNIRILRCLKEKLGLAIGKWLRLIINSVIYNNYTTKNLKNKAVLSSKQYCMRCYVTLSNVF